MFRRTLTALAVAFLAVYLPAAWGGDDTKEKAQQMVKAAQEKASKASVASKNLSPPVTAHKSRAAKPVIQAKANASQASE